MEIKKLIQSIECIEFANNLDLLVFDILYSKDGYLSLTSKDAVINANKYIEKFQQETEKLIKSSKVENTGILIQQKQKYILEKIKKHCLSESMRWADEVFQNLINNCLFEVSANKDKKYADKIYNRILCAISWICNVREFSDNDKKCMLEKYSKDFNLALQSKDTDFLITQVQVSDKNLFLRLFNLISNDCKKYCEINFDSYKNQLIKEDIILLKHFKNDLMTFKKTTLIDEIKLIQSALEISKLKDEEGVYEFIKEIQNDFTMYYYTNKRIEENDKVELIKHRLKASGKCGEKNYFKKLITLNV